MTWCDVCSVAVECRELGHVPAFLLYPAQADHCRLAPLTLSNIIWMWGNTHNVYIALYFSMHFTYNYLLKSLHPSSFTETQNLFWSTTQGCAVALRPLLMHFFSVNAVVTCPSFFPTKNGHRSSRPPLSKKFNGSPMERRHTGVETDWKHVQNITITYYHIISHHSMMKWLRTMNYI